MPSGGMMRAVTITLLLAGALAIAGRGLEAQGDGGYKLVPNWPKLPAGMYFGLKDAPPPPAERDAQAAARRASGRGSTASPQAGSAGSPQAGGGGGPKAEAMGAANPPGSSRPAPHQHERTFVFHRGG